MSSSEYPIKQVFKQILEGHSPRPTHLPLTGIHAFGTCRLASYKFHHTWERPSPPLTLKPT